MALRLFLFAALLWAMFPAQAQAQEETLLGTWENLTQGDLVGLTFTDGEHCNLYLERALQKRTNRACRYEPFEDRFLIFLFNEHGVCGSEADFEFIYEPNLPLVRLIISGSEVALSRAQPNRER
jgi:hypothetical protein